MPVEGGTGKVMVNGPRLGACCTLVIGGSGIALPAGAPARTAGTICGGGIDTGGRRGVFM